MTTVTLYQGTAPEKFLRQRLALIFENNPWLASRIVKKNTQDNAVSLEYSRNFEPRPVIDQYFTVYEHGDVGFSLCMPYQERVECLLSIQCLRSKPAADKDVPLFKVAVVPIEQTETKINHDAPLQRVVALPGFALVVSMNHTLGDGHTYY